MPRVRLGHRALREACAPQCPPSQDPRHPAVAGPLARPRLAALPRPLVRSMPLAVARMRAPGRCRISGWGRVSGCLCVHFCVHHTHTTTTTTITHTHTHTHTRIHSSAPCIMCFGDVFVVFRLVFAFRLLLSPLRQLSAHMGTSVSWVLLCLRVLLSPLQQLPLRACGYFCVSGCCCLRSRRFVLSCRG